MESYSEVSAEALIDLPRSVVWDKLRDLSLAHNYVPGVVRTEIVTTTGEGVGASRKVYQSATRALDETVEQWDPGFGFLIRVHRGKRGAPPPFRDLWFRYRLDDAGNNQTRFTATLRYRIAFGVFGRLFEGFGLRRVFRGVVRDIALSMKDYYETGEPVTPERRKALNAAR